MKSMIWASSAGTPRMWPSRIAVMVDSGTLWRRALPVCAPQTYTASSSRATVIAARTRTRMSRPPSKRT